MIGPSNTPDDGLFPVGLGAAHRAVGLGVARWFGLVASPIEDMCYRIGIREREWDNEWDYDFLLDCATRIDAVNLLHPRHEDGRGTGMLTFSCAVDNVGIWEPHSEHWIKPMWCEDIGRAFPKPYPIPQGQQADLMRHLDGAALEIGRRISSPLLRLGPPSVGPGDGLYDFVYCRFEFDLNETPPVPSYEECVGEILSCR